MADKRTSTVAAWAEEVQALSPSPIDLEESAAIALRSADLARNTAREFDIPFETEPSAFLKLLHELAPGDDA